MNCSSNEQTESNWITIIDSPQRIDREDILQILMKMNEDPTTRIISGEFGTTFSSVKLNLLKNELEES